jgi:hypothetical protein
MALRTRGRVIHKEALLHPVVQKTRVAKSASPSGFAGFVIFEFEYLFWPSESPSKT